MLLRVLSLGTTRKVSKSGESGKTLRNLIHSGKKSKNLPKPPLKNRHREVPKKDSVFLKDWLPTLESIFFWYSSFCFCYPGSPRYFFQSYNIFLKGEDALQVDQKGHRDDINLPLNLIMWFIFFRDCSFPDFCEKMGDIETVKPSSWALSSAGRIWAGRRKPRFQQSRISIFVEFIKEVRFLQMDFLSKCYDSIL